MNEAYLSSRACGRGKSVSGQEMDKERAALRFYSALMLQELIHETSLYEVAAKYYYYYYFYK